MVRGDREEIDRMERREQREERRKAKSVSLSGLLLGKPKHTTHKTHNERAAALLSRRCPTKKTANAVVHRSESRSTKCFFTATQAVLRNFARGKNPRPRATRNADAEEKNFVWVAARTHHERENGDLPVRCDVFVL